MNDKFILSVILVHSILIYAQVSGYANTALDVLDLTCPFIFMILKLLRVLRFFRVLHFYPNFTKLVQGFKIAMRESYAVLLSFAVINVIFGLINCSLFKEADPKIVNLPPKFPAKYLLVGDFFLHGSKMRISLHRNFQSDQTLSWLQLSLTGFRWGFNVVLCYVLPLRGVTLIPNRVESRVKK